MIISQVRIQLLKKKTCPQLAPHHLHHLSSALHTLCFAVYNSVALCFTVYHSVALCFTVYNSVTPCFTVYNSVALCFTFYNSVALCFTVYNSVALCFTVYNSVAPNNSVNNLSVDQPLSSMLSSVITPSIFSFPSTIVFGMNVQY